MSTLRVDVTSEQAIPRLDSLLEVAHERMSHAYRSSQSTLCWRRIYTDASLLRCIAEYAGPVPTPNAAECIARLDRAIIVAGPAGEGRLDLILLFISKLQRIVESKPSVLLCLVSTSVHPPLLPRTFAQPIPRLDVVPSLSSFLSRSSRAPFILPGFVRDWPAMNDRPWHSLDYLRKVSGPYRIVPVEVGQDYRQDDWTQTLMPWDDFLDALVQSHTDKSTAPVLYLAQHNLLNQFPGLRDDIVVPDYVYACPPPPDNYLAYCPPANADQLVVNAWLGPAGTVSPAHTVRAPSSDPALPLLTNCQDPFFNLYGETRPLFVSVAVASLIVVVQRKSSAARPCGSRRRKRRRTCTRTLDITMVLPISGTTPLRTRRARR